MPSPLISLLTDFGLRDPSAAILHGVIAGIAPEARVIDITHEVRKYRIRDGALMLWCALPWLPVGVHVAVIDPGVGTARRPIAVRVARGDVLVGPDNGLLLGPADRLGGAVAAVELTNPAYRLPRLSTSFHGRDLFAPVAAHLANGVVLEELGPLVDLATLVPSPLPGARVGEDAVESAVIYVDTFGNVKLSALADEVEAGLAGLMPGGRVRLERPGHAPVTLPLVRTFGDVAAGEPLLYRDSYDRACVAVNQGNAAEALDLAEDQPVRLRRAMEDA
ncbi:MAG TPA: SAM-dependent chlorinase/fluorinase [Candidatus Limnocylindrales bacterium]|nr:SAM-dependent chlorinase/fluorinase [Candidatus Limnocylindrales bacterium]